MCQEKASSPAPTESRGGQGIDQFDGQIPSPDSTCTNPRRDQTLDGPITDCNDRDRSNAALLTLLRALRQHGLSAVGNPDVCQLLPNLTEAGRHTFCRAVAHHAAVAGITDVLEPKDDRIGWIEPRPAFSREAAEEHHRLRGDRVLIVEAGSTRRVGRETPQVILDALVWAVGERGLSALDEPTNQNRLQTLSLEQFGEVQARIERLAAAAKIP